MSTMTFAFHPAYDSYNLPNTHTHSIPQNPPSITAPTSRHDSAFPANYDSWGLAPTLSPAQYGPPAAFHHGDETHGQPLDVHLPEASSLLFGGYAPPLQLELPQLSPSTILRHDTFQSVLGNAFNPLAPTGLAPQHQAPISLPTLDFPCLAPPPPPPPPPSLPPPPEPPASVPALPSDPLQSSSPPGRPASKRVSKRKRTCSVSREEDTDPHITSQLQADHRLPSSTTATTKSPSTSRTMSGRGGSSGMGPPPVPPPTGQQQWAPSTGTSSAIHHQHHHHHHHQPRSGYPTLPADEPSAKRRRVANEQDPSGRSIAQQQQQMDLYQNQQYQSQLQAYWCASGDQPTSAPISHPSPPVHGYPTFAGPSPRYPHAPSQNPPRFAAAIGPAPIPAAPPQWVGGGSTKEQYPHPAAYPQLQAYQQYTPPTGTYQASTPAGSSSSGSSSIARPTPPMAPGPMPPSATGPLVTRRLASPAGSKGAAAGPSALVSAPRSQVPHRGGSGGNPMGTGDAAPVMTIMDVNENDSSHHGPSMFPPEPYPGGETARSPWTPTREREKLYGSRLDQVRITFPALLLSYPPLSLYLKLSLKRFSIEPIPLDRVFPRGGGYSFIENSHANFGLTCFTDGRLRETRCSRWGRH